MIDLSDHPEGIVLPVRAQPGAGKNAIRSEQNGMLKVSVTQIAEKGKANKSLIEVLAKGLGLKRSQIELIAGETQPQKRFLIRGVSREELAKRIGAIIGPADREQ
jgi:uncharacterized protein